MRYGLWRFNSALKAAARRISLAGVIVGRVQPDGFIVPWLPFKSSLRGSRSREREGPQECEYKCGFHSNDSIWVGKKSRNCPKGQAASRRIVPRCAHPKRSQKGYFYPLTVAESLPS